MIYRIFILINLLVFATSCQQKDSKKVDLEKYVVNKVWLNFLDENPYQLYFNKSDGKRYMYLATEIRGEDRFDLNNIYTPWKKYKGTPETNPQPAVEKAIYLRNYEGWSDMEYFKVMDNMILYQDFDDISGKELDTVFIEKGKDTLIGIFNYETLKTQRTDMMTGKPWHQTWVSKIK